MDDVHTSTVDEASTAEVCKCFDLFCSSSGMSINNTKSLILNQISDNNFNLCPIPESGFKHIGIPINANGFYFNPTEHLCRARSTANKLKNLHLSIYGSRHICHAYIFSAISYQLYILTPSKTFFKDLNKSISSFLWPTKAKVSFKRLCQSPENSGIGIFNMESKALALKSSLLLKIISHNSTTTLALSEWFFHYKNNNILTPLNIRLKLSPLLPFFQNLPTIPSPTTGAFKSKSNLIFKIHSHRTVCIKDTLSPQDLNLCTTIKKPHFQSLIPVPFTMHNNHITLTQNLHHLLNTFLASTPPSSLKTIYTEILSRSIPPPPLSPATLSLLHLHNLPNNIFSQIPKLKVRPYLRQFFYLYLLNSLPLSFSSPCPACKTPLRHNHIFQQCYLFSNLSTDPNTNTLIPWVIHKASIWLTFNWFSHNNIPFSVSSATEKYHQVLQKEHSRQHNLQLKHFNNTI